MVWVVVVVVVAVVVVASTNGSSCIYVFQPITPAEINFMHP